MGKTLEDFKHFNDMNWKERCEYRIFLRKNNLWDGAEMIDRKIREKTLTINPKKGE